MNPFSPFSRITYPEFLSEISKKKIQALLPIVRNLYPNVQFEMVINPQTEKDSISFCGYMHGQMIVQYSFWGNEKGDIYSITAYATDFLLQTLYQTFSKQGSIWGFKIINIELDYDELPHFLDITLDTDN